MSVLGTLATVALRYTVHFTLHGSADAAVAWLRERYSDHTRVLPDALALAHDRAWQAVGLALAGDSLFSRGTELFRDGDLTAARSALRDFLAGAETGLDQAPARVRVAAAGELARLRKQGRLPTESGRPTALAGMATPAAGVEAAVAAAGAVADELAPAAPNLARVLRLAPPGGFPLLVTAFLFFFRRAVEVHPEVARGLTFDALRTLARDQAEGFERLHRSAAGLLDQFDVLFDALDRWRAATDHKLDQIIARLDLLDTVARLARSGGVSADPAVPLSVSVTAPRDREALARLPADLRRVPAGLLEPADLSRAGDVFDAGGLFGLALATHEAAAEAARGEGDRAAEAEARYKAFRDACELGRWPDALAALNRALALDPGRFAPFPLGRYEILDILGVGGFGTVFHCRERAGARREVAVKSLHAAATLRDPGAAFREADVLAELDHPGIVRVWDKGFADPVGRTRPYLVVEYFPGGTLADRLRTGGPLPVAVGLSVARQLAGAMRAAHARGVFHRDIKPANVLACPLAGGPRGELEVKLIDFGLAAPVGTPAGGAGADDGTHRGASIHGTMRYASPEQKGELPGAVVGPAADIYSFGKTIQEALFGTTEPKDRDWAGLPSRVRRPLQALLERATEQSPAARFRSFDEVVVALAGIRPGRWWWKPAAATAVAAGLVAAAVGSAGRGHGGTATPDHVAPPTEVGRRPTAPPLPPPPVAPPRPVRKAGEKRLLPLGKSGVVLPLVWVPPGSFDRAEAGEESGRVTLTRGFWAGQTEVTRGQWRAMLGGDGGDPDLPVAGVSHDACLEFCREAADQTGQAVGLPTEAQWEHLCRAGTSSRYFFGGLKADLAAYAWCEVNCPGPTRPVGTTYPNPWGLSDTYGNVAEWCSDWFAPYPPGPVTDPPGSAQGVKRVVRGGSWFGGPGQCRSGYRDSLAPQVSSPYVGFRVVVAEASP